MKEIITSIEIDAPIERVWQVLSDGEKFPLWNPFIISVEGKFSDEKVKILLMQKNGKKFSFEPKILAYKPNQELRWKGKFFLPEIFDGEHYFLLEKISSGKTKILHGEKFSGVLIPFMGKLLRETKENFVSMNEALKERVLKDG